jgi:ATP-dependent DNA helicase 2 subunit 2
VVDAIGSVDPVGDLKAMLARKDKDLSGEAVRGMIAQIKAFVGPDGGAMYFPKALECLQALRVAALQCEAEEEFNEFATQLKGSLVSAGANSFWHKMVDAQVKLISCTESNAVDVTPEQADAFLAVTTAATPQATDAPAAAVDDDDDLMDDFE